MNHLRPPKHVIKHYQISSATWNLDCNMPLVQYLIEKKYVNRVKETVFTVQILSRVNYYSYKYPK